MIISTEMGWIFATSVVLFALFDSISSNSALLTWARAIKLKEVDSADDGTQIWLAY
jgi:hypothetical protein